MSGFIAVVNLDGSPVDPDLLRRLTQTMAYRGPDAQEIHVLDNVGLGCALLRTTFEAAREQQPCSLDGKSWIVADCRIDAREELVRELGGADLRNAADPELILHAWTRWGEDCVSHLLGDFSFAIWDARQRKLFCARDQLGLKLLYYAPTSKCLIISNALQPVRMHPAVSGKLNDLAIADFLMFGGNHDATTTSFEGVHRLRGGHRLALTDGALRIDRYWELPIDPPLRLRRREDYAEHFLELLRTAMRDRLRCEKVAVMMSGGLDSAGIAAIAKEISAESGNPQLAAYTVVFDSLLPDRERYYAELVAKRVDIPIHFEPQDDYRLFEVFPDTDLSRIPDPAHVSAFGPDSSRAGALAMAVADGARVALQGDGPDDALYYEWRPYVTQELRRGNVGQLLSEAISFPFLFGRVPAWGRRKNAQGGHGAYTSGFPTWFQRDFASRLNLEERYGSRPGGEAHAEHPFRPIGHSGFAGAGWQFLFEAYDPEVTGLPLEVRQPYLDIRMLRFLLSVPVVPWCRNKYLLRRALQHHLPAEVIARPKQGLPGFPNYEQWKRSGMPKNLPKDRVSEYVDLEVLGRLVIESPQSFGDSLRPLGLGIFLAQRRD